VAQALLAGFPEGAAPVQLLIGADAVAYVKRAVQDALRILMTRDTCIGLKPVPCRYGVHSLGTVYDSCAA
jgi:hypothetical protein